MLYFSWLLSLVSTFGSLFLSEVLSFVPCELCWYQRIAMYPIFILYSVAIGKKRNDVVVYTLPFIGLGLFISLYHNLLQRGLLDKAFAPCRSGMSCQDVQWTLFGMSIPVLSFIAFFLLMILAWKMRKCEN